MFNLGTLATAQTYLVRGIALYDRQQHGAAAFLYGDEDGLACHSVAAWTLWCLGYPDQGLTRSQEAVTLAQQIAHPFSLGFALMLAATFHSLRREVRVTQECAEAVISLATDRGFPQLKAISAILRGWTLAHQEQAKAGIEQLTQGLSALRATGAEINQSYFLALLAEAYSTLGQPETGLTMLTQALTHAATRGERWYESALYCLKGELLLQQSSHHQVDAEACFHHALEIARMQHAKSFELRTATSLARLWQQQGKRQEAHDLLAHVYSWFTEGLDTADLKNAKALLDALA